MRYLIPIVLVTSALLALDLYVYRNWRRFARHRCNRCRWTLPVYGLFMVVMPFTLPVYLNVYSWWEVEPRLARALFFSFWALYYLPKVPIAAVLLAKDVARLGRWSYQKWIDPQKAASVGASEKAITRAEFLRQVGWSVAAVPFIATGYGVYRTLYDFAVHRVDVPIAGLPRAFEGMTVAQLSDLHAGSLLSDRPMWEAVRIVHDLRPDLIALTGDFVNHDTEEMGPIMPAIRELRADLGIYGCLGNHDHYADTGRLVEALKTSPVDLLVNTHRSLEIDGAKLHVIGTDNTGFRQHYGDLPKAVAGIAEQDAAAGESAQILLAHDPTFWDIEVRPDYADIDLMLCGHTHGGQFGFELGPLRWSLAQIRYERWAGLYSEPRAEHGGRGRGAQFLYVNRGLGTVGPPLRLGIRPEITLITLRCA